MKTPQENPAETAEAVAAKILADKCPHQPRGQVITCLDCITAMQKRYADIRVAAAREEGRREGIEQAAQLARGYSRRTNNDPDLERITPGLSVFMSGAGLQIANEIRALASQPKPEPAVTCEGCKRGLPFDGYGNHVYPETDPRSEAGFPVTKACTAKPEGGKEPGT